MRVNKNTFVLLLLPFLIVACVENPTLLRSKDSTAGDESADGASDPVLLDLDPERNILPPDLDGDELGRRIDDPEPAICKEASRIESFNLQPDVSRGANVIFLIDDSGSMGTEILGVVQEIQPFVDGLLQASNNNHRIIFLFNKRRSVIKNTFSNQNPFQDQIDNVSTFYIESHTWSSWADAAFFRAFGQTNFSQSVNPMPLDGFESSPEHIFYADCQNPGDYFRPRTFRRWDYTISSCLSAENRNKIENILLPGYSVSLVALSDDDINAYPQVALNMFQEVLKPLGSDTPIIYHSIVGTVDGAFNGVGGNNLDRKGENHMALSNMTGGRIHDIRQYDEYDLIFEQLKEDIIFGAQALDVQCSFNGDEPRVTFNNNLVNSANYVLQADSKKINFLPDAFIGYENVASITVKVTY